MYVQKYMCGYIPHACLLSEPFNMTTVGVATTQTVSIYNTLTCWSFSS